MAKKELIKKENTQLILSKTKGLMELTNKLIKRNGRDLVVNDNYRLHIGLGHSDWVRSVAFSPDGKYLASGSEDKTIKLWDTESGKEIKSFEGHTDWVNSVAFSPDGKYIASGGKDTTVKLWDVESGREIKSFKGHTDWVNSVAFSPDGKYIASGGDDTTIKLWDVESGREIKSFEGYWNIDKVTGSINVIRGHWRSINSIIFSPDGKYIASGSKDRTLKLWDIESGREIKSFKGHSYWINSVAFSPNGKYIASGSEDRTIKLWDVESGREIKSFKGHSWSIWSVAFSPDGKYIASGDNTTIKLWDVESGKEIVTIAIDKDGEWIAWNRDGYYDYSNDTPLERVTFVDESGGMPKVVDINHPIYKQKRKKGLLEELLK